MIENVINFLNKGWVGSILGIGGILMGIWFYRKSKRSPKISVHLDANRMIGWGNNDILPKNLTVQYKGLPVERISRVIVRIWNSGNDTLESSLIPKSEPFRLELQSENSEILSVLILRESTQANKFSTIIDPNKKNKLIINFDYIDPNEGVIIGIMHTDSIIAPIFKGIIKGHKINILRDYKNIAVNYIKKYFYPNIISILNKLLLGAGLATFILALFLPDNIFFNLNPNQLKSKDILELREFFIILGFTYFAIGYLLYWSKKLRYPKNLEHFGADTIKFKD